MMLWMSEKSASRFHEGLKKCIMILWRSEKVHQDFMKVEKICSRIYEGHKNTHLLVYERFNHVHHCFMKALKARIAFL